MKKVFIYIGLIGICMSGCITSQKKGELFDKENLVAWCIVPFDAEERSPEQRAVMLGELGISALAYDYRDSHIPSFPEEIEVLKAHDICLQAVWLWADPRQEDVMGEAGRILFDMLEASDTQTEVWVGMPEDAFEGLSGEESLALAVSSLREILVEAEKIGCTLALYNHGGWYGEPGNLVRIIEELGNKEVRIVYNFHHGHEHLDRFPEYLDLMLPYLSTINLNGMRAEGPKIITLGNGDRELEMMRAIQASAFSGSIGIIGHTDGEDIRPVLERNLQGLEKLKYQLRN
ncbi:MAG: AP endonuclease [Bacteroidia bacterium]|nr:MAG: AP endonuclease [Bacteroidia bacterium]